MDTSSFTSDMQALCDLLNSDHELRAPYAITPSAYGWPLHILVEPMSFRGWLNAIGEHQLTIDTDKPNRKVTATAVAAPEQFHCGIEIVSLVRDTQDDHANLAGLAACDERPVETVRVAGGVL